MKWPWTQPPVSGPEEHDMNEQPQPAQPRSAESRPCRDVAAEKEREALRVWQALTETRMGRLEAAVDVLTRSKRS